MKILYDYQIFRSQRYGGISRYYTNLIKYGDRKETHVPIFHSKNYYYNKLTDRFDHKYESMLFEWISNTFSKVLTYLTLHRNHIEIFHPTSNDPYFIKMIRDEKVVVTVHDLVRERFPDLNPRTESFIERRREILRKADHIIAVSEHTKEDLTSYYHIPEDKITVVYHGLPLQFGKINITLRGLPKRYLLFVGERGQNKNFVTFLEAAAPELNKDSSLYILCVGGGEFSEQEKELMNVYGIARQIRQKTLNDELLAACYNHALAFVFPSIYEGFGIPILEAMSMNCPLLISDIPSFREVAMDAGTYFDPTCVSDLRKQIRWIINENNINEVSNKVMIGKERVKHFTLDHTYAKTYNVYKKVLGIDDTTTQNQPLDEMETLNSLLDELALEEDANNKAAE